MGSYEFAKRIQMKVIERYPAFIFGYSDYADTLWRTNDFATAFEEIEKALVLGSKNIVIKGKKTQILQSKAIEPNLTSEERLHLHQEVVRLFESSESLEKVKTSKQQKDKCSTVLHFSEEYLQGHNYKNEKSSVNNVEKSEGIDTRNRYGMNR